MSNSDEHLIKVVIVDDEPLIRMDLKEMLHESLVYKVVGEAKDGIEVLELVKDKEPDIIFMDIRMPKQDGITTAKQIQEAFSHTIPIVMLTAYSQQDLIEQASDAGVFAYLTKPLRKPDLIPAIEISLARASEMRELRQQVNTLKEKMETRKMVERAKGLLMNKFDIPEQVAYRKLQKEAMDKRMSLKEIAQILLETLATN